MLALTGLVPATQAVARPSAAPFLTEGGDLDAPRGFVAMCRQGGELCSPNGARPVSADMGPADAAGPAPAGARRAAIFDGTPHLMLAIRSPAISGDTRTGDTPSAAGQAELLQHVNRFVNGHVRQETDLQIFGAPEVWAASGTGPDARGDCEDLAIEKRLELIHAGFPADHLFFALVYRGDIGLHTLLVARTDRGDVVLDSRTPYIVPWNEAPYAWVGLQSRSDPMKWYRPGARTFQMADALGGKSGHG